MATVDPLWDIAQMLYDKKLNRMARAFEVISMTISSHAISAKIKTGKATRFYHHGLGCVIREAAFFGDNCGYFKM